MIAIVLTDVDIITALRVCARACVCACVRVRVLLFQHEFGRLFHLFQVT